MLHREWSIWNQMKSGFAADNNEEVNYPLLEEKTEKYTPFDNEKQGKQRKSHRLGHYFLLISSLWLLIYKLNPCGVYTNFSGDGDNNKSILSNVQDFPQNPQSIYDDGQVHEIIEIPFYPSDNLTALGEPVYTSQLTRTTFGQSWGHLDTLNYTAPPAEIEFNKIVLILDVNVTGIQYDRLINIYLDDVEIWRSSTVEPAGQASHLQSIKDISQFKSLFQKDSELKFQLDNIINSRLTGSFDVNLEVKFYNIVGKSYTDYPQKVQNVIPVKHSDEGSAIHIPDKLANVELPYINYNTTKLHLAITTSANAEEEFWYSNVLDELKDTFSGYGHKLSGHGSCRVVNVFLDGVRIHSANPIPVVFTGGISPALWDPIVSDGSLHIDPLSVDLTPVLPWLWGSPEAAISIEITNCLDDDEKAVKKSGIGSNWITSAFLNVWEDPEVVDSYGEVITFDNTTKITGFGLAPPFSGVLNQVITAKYSNSMTSNITLVYENGTEFSAIREVSNKIKQTALTFISHFGDIQSLLVIPKTNDTLTILDDEMNVLDDFHFKKSGSLKIDLNSTIAKKAPLWGPPTKEPSDINLEVNITKSHKFSMGLNDLTIIDIKAKENGTSSFVISQNGNHGVGTMEHKYRALKPSGELYQRHALGSNGTVIYDDITSTPMTPPEEMESVAEMLNEYQLQVLHESLHCNRGLLKELLQ